MREMAAEEKSRTGAETVYLWVVMGVMMPMLVGGGGGFDAVNLSSLLTHEAQVGLCHWTMVSAAAA